MSTGAEGGGVPPEPHPDDARPGPRSVVLSALLVAAVGLGAILAAPLVPAVNAVVIALLAGLLVANLAGRRVEVDDRVSTFVLKRVLRAAIILLGAGINLALVADVGVKALAVITVSVLVAILVARLAGPRLGLTGRSSLLIGIGTAICGVSAIVAVAPVLRARKEEMGLALATILSFNALALLLYPLVGNVLAFDAITFGTWAGVAVHDTASAVATGFALGPQAGEVATLVKLVRTLYLIPVMVLAALWMSVRVDRGAVSASGTARAVLSSMPWFVFGFAVLAVLNSAGLLLGIGDVLSDLAKLLIVFVVATIGLTLRLSGIASLGRPLLYTGFAASVAIGIVSLSAIALLGVGA